PRAGRPPEPRRRTAAADPPGAPARCRSSRPPPRNYRSTFWTSVPTTLGVIASEPDTHLTHGWEPELAVYDPLLRRFLFAFADRLAAMADGVGGRLRRTPEAAYADPHSAFVFDNGVGLLQ